MSSVNTKIQSPSVSHNSNVGPRDNDNSHSFSDLAPASINPSRFAFSKISIQAKMKISQPDDAYEQEADKVADRVMGMALPSSITQAAVQVDRIDRKCTTCELEKKDKKLSISRKPSMISSSNFEVNNDEFVKDIDNIRSSSRGSSLDQHTRYFMESRFDYDFSSVKIHTHGTAVKTAQAINARAYTIGNDIVFGEGEYQPNTREGRKLLAHELTHVVQQNSQQMVTKPMAKSQNAGRNQNLKIGVAHSGNNSSIQTSLIQRDLRNRDPIHGPIIENYRRWHGLPPGGEDEFGRQVGPTDSQIKYGVVKDPPLTESEIEQRLIAETTRLSNGSDSLLTRDYVSTALSARNNNAPLSNAIKAAVQEVGQDIFSIQMLRIERLARGIIRLLETQFINDPSTSSLDLLPSNKGQRYRNFKWDVNDYPGGPGGSHEGVALTMVRDLSNIRPERRANAGSQAVVTKSQYTSAMERHVTSELESIPDFPAPASDAQGTNEAATIRQRRQPAGRRLNRHALQSFLAMREAALQDGVELIALDAYRAPSVAAANAERSGNPMAVASFSSHMLGLAVDLKMSYVSQSAAGTSTPHNYSEMTTTPMQNVVDMRESPAHKWMFMRGESFGWYPYQNEPWHWEYNPPGFRDTFREGLGAASP